MNFFELFAAGICMLLSMWVIVPRVRDCLLARQTERWALTTGLIIERYLEARPIRLRYGGSASLYVPHISYRYSVDGTSYTASGICFGKLPRYLVEERAAQRYAAYAEGAEVPVVYNPAAPGEAVLETEVAGDWGEVCLAALFFCGILWIVLRNV